MSWTCGNAPVRITSIRTAKSIWSCRWKDRPSSTVNQAGWKVYAPGSDHFPTVRGGRALVLYLLPAGAIQFTGKRASEMR